MLNGWMDVFGEVLVDLSSRYSSIHGRLVYPLTIVGMLTSVVTIVVLQRKNFRTPTNLILQHVAFFDTMVLLFYNLYSLYFYILHEPNPFVGQSIFWPRFAIINAHVGLTAHSIALWLTCLLALIRYLLISRRDRRLVLKTKEISLFIWSVVLIVCSLMIPTYLVWHVGLFRASDVLPGDYSNQSNASVYWIRSATGGRLEKISFGMIAICLKILPVGLLIVFSLLLIRNILSGRELRERLRRRCSSLHSSSLIFTRELRTTTMLVFITSFTVVVELPQGLLLVGIGIDERLFTLYSQLGDFWDFLSISSSFITFVMYCSMSQQFRQEMFHLLSPTNLLFASNKEHHIPRQQR